MSAVFESLTALLPELSRIVDPSTRGELITRSVELLARHNSALTKFDVLTALRLPSRNEQKAELSADLEEAYLCAIFEQHPDALGELLEAHTGMSSRAALVRRALRLGWFAEARSAMGSWDVRTVLLACPFDELNRCTDGREILASQFCCELGIRHPIVYRAAARRGDRSFLEHAAAETLELETSDFNGGLSRHIVPWAFGALVRESAAAGLVEFAERQIRDAANSKGPPLTSQRAWADLVHDVALAASRHAKTDCALRMLEDFGAPLLQFDVPLDRILARIALAAAEDLDDVLVSLPESDAAPFGRELVEPLFWELLETNDLEAARRVARFASVLRTTATDAREFESRLSKLASALCEKYCGLGDHRAAVTCAEQLLSGRALRNELLVVAYRAAAAGDTQRAVDLMSGMDDEACRHLVPLVVEDISNEPAPAHHTLEERLRWAVLGAEAVLGRSKALTGFGIPS